MRRDASWRVGGLIVALLTVVAAVVACEHAEQPTVDMEQLALRDVLGMDTRLHRELDGPARESLEGRIVEASASESDWLEGWTDTETPFREVAEEAPFDRVPDDPLNTLRRLDGWREAQGQDAWVFGVFLQDADGVGTFGCPTQGAELKPEAQASWPRSWELVDDFGGEAQEVGRLRSLARGLEGWRTRCLGERDIPNVYSHLRVVRQPNAPFLLSYWPQRYSLYVHPLLLELWGQEASAEEELRTVQQAHHLDADYDACLGWVTDQCILCTREYTSAHPGECQPFYPQSGVPVYDDCRRLQFEISDGIYRYCADEFLEFASVTECFRSAASAELCGVPEDVNVGDVASLATYYAGFSNPGSRQLCRAALTNCTSEADRDGDGVGDAVDRCSATPSGTAVDSDPNSWRAGCGPSECLDGDTYCMDQENPPKPPEFEPTCETDCWQWALNDSGCNDCGGGALGFELIWYDYERPALRDTCTENSQPTTCCGDEPKIPNN